MPLLPSLTRGALRMLGSCALMVLIGQAVYANDSEGLKFRRVPTQFIAALGDPKASSGTGAQSWGIWRNDPGPRGVRLERFDQLESAGGKAPAQWQFNTKD